jgi:hypothetical protein
MKQRRGMMAPKCADKDPEGRPLCACGCGKRPEGRRTVWFSKECHRGWMLLWHIKSQRSHVFARDGGKCQLCGCLPEQLRAATRAVGKSYHKSDAENAAIRAKWQAAQAAAKADGWPDASRNTRSWWEMDHIVELADGGTNDLANLRVLCYRCHKAKTRASRSARSKR